MYSRGEMYPSARAATHEGKKSSVCAAVIRFWGSPCKSHHLSPSHRFNKLWQTHEIWRSTGGGGGARNGKNKRYTDTGGERKKSLMNQLLRRKQTSQELKMPSSVASWSLTSPMNMLVGAAVHCTLLNDLTSEAKRRKKLKSKVFFSDWVMMSSNDDTVYPPWTAKTFQSTWILLWYLVLSGISLLRMISAYHTLQMSLRWKSGKLRFNHESASQK